MSSPRPSVRSSQQPTNREVTAHPQRPIARGVPPRVHDNPSLLLIIIVLIITNKNPVPHVPLTLRIAQAHPLAAVYRLLARPQRLGVLEKCLDAELASLVLLLHAWDGVVYELRV